MRSRAPARKLSTNTQLYMSAQRALMRRAFSIHEMKAHLERRAEEKDLVPPVIARLRELNYLNDEKFAFDYAAQHAKLRRQGRFRITRELRQRGVPDRYIDDALAKVFADTDESALLRTRVERRLARLRGPLDQKKTASLYRHLIAAGFPADQIRTELKRATANQPTASAAPNEDLDADADPEFDPDSREQ
ncbi:MAG TPA: regulatory protein RecX [Candidatus Acidoferrales bacterium]